MPLPHVCVQGNVLGKTSAYSVLCEEFMQSVLCEQDVEGSSLLNEEDMVNVSIPHIISQSRREY